ncbi:MAG TPA: glycosyltransferase family 4 protein [Candidatus Binataceae bacterium]|nr:glycosyltransferase family 4 protein [Candidatus Binataceae bacterium]
MKVLLVSNRLFTHDVRLRRNAEALAKRGDSVDVICTAEEGHNYTGPVHLVAFPCFRYRGNNRLCYLGYYLDFLVRASWRATLLAFRRRYDVVIAVSMPDAIVFACVGARLFGSKLILDITDTMPELYQDRFGKHFWDVGGKLLALQERLSAWFADRVLAVHELHRQRLMTAGIDSTKIRVVMNSPDPSIFRHERLCSTKSVAFTLIYHGSIIRRLGLDIALQAVASARQTIPQLRLWIFGSGDYLQEARQLALRLNIDNVVTFFGFVPAELIVPYIAQAHVGLVPYYANEATQIMLPMKLLEYSMLGVPVIASRLSAIEYYFGEHTLRYVAPGDINDLTNAIVELYARPDLRERLSGRCRKALQPIAWNNQCRELFSAVDTLVSH